MACHHCVHTDPPFFPRKQVRLLRELRWMEILKVFAFWDKCLLYIMIMINPWTPKPWKMRVFNSTPQIWVITPKNEGYGFPGINEIINSGGTHFSSLCWTTCSANQTQARDVLLIWPMLQNIQKLSTLSRCKLRKKKSSRQQCRSWECMHKP